VGGVAVRMVGIVRDGREPRSPGGVDEEGRCLHGGDGVEAAVADGVREKLLRG
jgi:hypothetical protein